MLVIGNVNKLKVLRETDIGYMLNTREEEVFLHKNESNYLELKANDTVNAFLYFDEKSRLAATLKTPFLTVDKPAYLEVVSVLPRLGVFLNMGINKDVLLSKDDLPNNFNLWPKEGSKLFVSLHIKTNRLVAKIVNPAEIYEVNDLEIGVEKKFFVQRIGEQGINLYNEDKEMVFVHNSLIRDVYHLGEEVSVKIIKMTDKGYLGTLIKQKEEQRLDDATVILNALKRYGKIPLTAKSSSEEIDKFFKISRKSFKRAIGYLYKENKVKFTENETILIDGE